MSGESGAKRSKTAAAMFTLDSSESDDEEQTRAEPEMKRKSVETTARREEISSSPPDSDDSPAIKLTQAQLDRIEANRKRALEIKRAKELEREEQNAAVTAGTVSETIVPAATTSSEKKKLIDTGAGFYLDEEDLIEEQIKEKNIVQDPPVPIPSEQIRCERCQKSFADSFLRKNFDLNVCDACKVKFSENYELITRTDAKEEFMLKDCDFDFRDPPLKFISKRNPHNTRWGDMKLYLRCQIEQRSVEVHESNDKLEEKKELKLLNLHKSRQKNYEKKLADLRKDARQGAKKLTEFHQHDYGEPTYSKKKDKFYKICKTCEYKFEYEEL